MNRSKLSLYLMFSLGCDHKTGFKLGFLASAAFVLSGCDCGVFAAAIGSE